MLSVKGAFPTKQKLCPCYARALFMIAASFKQAPDGKATHEQKKTTSFSSSSRAVC